MELIDRSKLEAFGATCKSQDYMDGVKAVLEYIDNLTPVDAELVRHGKWIYGNDFHWYTASCNKCGYQRKTDIKAEGWNQWKFCPNCGAKMEKQNDSFD